MEFSKSLVLNCFPNKEAIQYNIDIALQLMNESEKLADEERIVHLCECHKALVKKRYEEASLRAAEAGYKLMGAAIKHHYL